MYELAINDTPVKIWAKSIDPHAWKEIMNLASLPFVFHHLAFMPDLHGGMGMPIGGILATKNVIIPNAVGVDIGCGMCAVKTSMKLSEIGTDVLKKKIMSGIRSRIPVGFDHHKDLQDEAFLPQGHDVDKLTVVKAQYIAARHQIGTLGGGNHFIELDCDDEGCLYLVVHSGSRHIGLEVAEYYQNQGRYALWGGARYQLNAMIEELKAAGRHREIEPMIRKMRKEHPIDIPKDLAYVEGRLFDEYIHDMRIVQGFAMENRRAMVQTIVKGLHLTPEEQFTTIHNYIDTESMILRKGSVSARKHEKLLIPINMRDGSLICLGKGNPDWNCSAPHGAGRLMSRKAAMNSLSLEEYRSEMSGIFSTCVSKATLDEAPMAYKSMNDIVDHIGPTADIVKRIQPVYNFKAAE
jgi:RNA-splicing ligase RtcB